MHGEGQIVKVIRMTETQQMFTQDCQTLFQFGVLKLKRAKHFVLFEGGGNIYFTEHTCQPTYPSCTRGFKPCARALALVGQSLQDGLTIIYVFLQHVNTVDKLGMIDIN